MCGYIKCAVARLITTHHAAAAIHSSRSPDTHALAELSSALWPLWLSGSRLERRRLGPRRGVRGGAMRGRLVYPADQTPPAAAPPAPPPPPAPRADGSHRSRPPPPRTPPTSQTPRNRRRVARRGCAARPSRWGGRAWGRRRARGRRRAAPPASPPLRRRRQRPLRLHIMRLVDPGRGGWGQRGHLRVRCRTGA